VGDAVRKADESPRGFPARGIVERTALGVIDTIHQEQAEACDQRCGERPAEKPHEYLVEGAESPEADR
jgi:hypothetical protein